MKYLTLFALVLTLTFTSCSTVKVVSDYDSKTNFTTYKTFAFYKPGIDQAQISDLDKKRIMREIKANLSAKGMTISETPDLLITIFTKERQRVDVYNNSYGYWGYGYGPWYGGYGGFGGNTVSTSTEGTLYIDFIDKATNELVWQGIGKGDLVMSSVEKKEARIKEIVSKIIAQYPPVVEVK